jgi:hypothetical protein
MRRHGPRSPGANARKEGADDARRVARRRHHAQEGGHRRSPLEYDQFQLGVERQISDKRRSQIDSLQRIIELSGTSKETPDLLFRLGELYFEEARDYFFQANRKDDDLIRGLATRTSRFKKRPRRRRPR